MFLFDCLRRFGCPSLLPKSPFTSTFPVRLRDLSTMGCSDSTSTVTPVAGKEGTHTHSTHDGTSSSSIGSSSNSSSSVGSINRIVSMYRGLVNKDLWLTEENTASGSGAVGQGEGEGEVPVCSTGTGRSHPLKGLPPVFALVRATRSLERGQDNAEMKAKERGDGDVSTSSSTADTEDAHDWKVTTLAAAWDDRYSCDTYIVCADTSSSSTALGWGVRNVLALLATHLPATKTSQGDQKGDRKETSNSSSSPVRDTDSASGSGSRASCNIIALRGVLAKRLHKCASREKATSLLDTLTDTQLG